MKRLILFFLLVASTAFATVTLPKTWVASETLKAADLNANFVALKGALDVIQPDAVPVGTSILYTGTSLPSGYLRTDGSAVSRTTYSDLFSAIGTSYNNGTEASGSFRLPDMASFTVSFDTASGTATATFIIKY